MPKAEACDFALERGDGAGPLRLANSPGYCFSQAEGGFDALGPTESHFSANIPATERTCGKTNRPHLNRIYDTSGTNNIHCCN